MGRPANTGTCRSCGKPMIWVLTEHGRKMPLDADPADVRRPLAVDDGNLVICKVGTDGEPDTVRNVKAGKGRYRSHFASCPNRRDHRKTKARQRHASND